MRVPNWPIKLAAFIEERRSMKFKWGENDCCAFACAWLEILVGFDPSVDFECYATAKKALKVLEKEGGVEKIAEQVCAKQGWPECNPLRAQRGDIVLTDTPHQGAALGVCVGSRCAFPGLDGITFKLTGEVRRAWRID
jgi:hypothetical protein